MTGKTISQTPEIKKRPLRIESGELLAIRGARILGVNPPVRDFAFMDLWSKPLGLLYLLQSVREHNEVSLLDCVALAAEGEKSFGRAKIRKTEIEKPEVYRAIPRRYNHFGLGKSEITSLLASVKAPDYIFLTSAMTYWYPGVRWMIEVLKEIFPQSPVALGGHIRKPVPGTCGGARGRPPCAGPP